VRQVKRREKGEREGAVSTSKTGKYRLVGVGEWRRKVERKGRKGGNALEAPQRLLPNRRTNRIQHPLLPTPRPLPAFERRSTVQVEGTTGFAHYDGNFADLTVGGSEDVGDLKGVAGVGEGEGEKARMVWRRGGEEERKGGDVLAQGKGRDGVLQGK
jgi:hypothetical protein